MDLSIIMTFKSDNGGYKDKHLKFIQEYYNKNLPNAELIIQYDNESDMSKKWLDFNKSKQLNLGVQRATRNNLLITDIDMIISVADIVKAYEEIIIKKFILMAGILVELDQTTTDIIFEQGLLYNINELDYTKFTHHINKDTQANGCYMTTKALYNACGGHDERFVGWGSEDAQFILCAVTMNDRKIYRSKGLVYHMYHERSGDRPRNDDAWIKKEKIFTQYNQAYGRKSLMKELIESRNIKDKNNILMCMYVVGGYDAQRGIYWKANIEDLMPLINSLNGQRLIVLNNCFEEGLKIGSAEFVRIRNDREPYRASWYLYRDYLKEHKEIDYVWHIDSTDVVLINNPFKEMSIGKIYVGSEEQVVGCNWIRRTTTTPVLLSFIQTYRNRTLLNAGLLGGSRKDVLQFCSDMCQLYDGDCNDEMTNMPIFNYLAYRKYRSQIEFGSHINTKFKEYEYDNKFAWFRHK